jgi:hypothetical protein
MARLTPRTSGGLAAAGGLCGAALAILLAGCSDTTYGTGVNPGTQTLKDIAGIAMMGGKKPTIDYEPRAKIVAPPPGATAALPPPAASGKGTQTADAGGDDGVANPPNWPKDPDIASAKFQADIAARGAQGGDIAARQAHAAAGPGPEPNLPPGMLSQSTEAAGNPTRRGLDDSKPLTEEQNNQVRKAFADAKGSLSVDANGKPVRRYLTDPPVQYREPDPTQPVTFTEKKKFHWWWQKKTDDAGDLAPAADASTTQRTPPGT